MEDLTSQIRDALGMMDSMDDDQWTADGSPKVDVVNDLGELEGVTRAQILDAAPKFSRENFDVTAAEPEIKEPAKEINTQGYKHPEIVAAQEAYDKTVKALGAAKAAEKEAGLVLSKATNRLMNLTKSRSQTTHDIRAAIKASNDARAARVAEFNANKAMITGKAPRSTLDEAKGKERKVRPKMEN